jgi:hypothetical protein
MRIRTILAAAAAPAALAAILLGTAGQASAATTAKPVTITANTHLNNHPDTTDHCGVGLIKDDCVWAYDNATEKFTLVQDPSDPSGHTWQVSVDYVGSFHGFADPSGPYAGAALTSDGPVKGTITFTVTSNATPDPSRLPGQSTSDAHLTDNIKTLFGNDPSTSTVISGGDQYTFSYQNGSYVQRGAPEKNSTTGDVTGH